MPPTGGALTAERRRTSDILTRFIEELQSALEAVNEYDRVSSEFRRIVQDGNGAMRQRRGGEDGARSPTSSPKQLRQPEVGVAAQRLKRIRGLKASGWAHSADPVANGLTGYHQSVCKRPHLCEDGRMAGWVTAGKPQSRVCTG